MLNEYLEKVWSLRAPLGDDLFLNFVRKLRNIISYFDTITPSSPVG